MIKQNQCQSACLKDFTCKDGFIQVAQCKGFEGSTIPYCLRDDLPVHFINEDGSPRFYKGKNDKTN